MGRLSTLTVILILAGWGGTTEGSPLQDAVSSPPATARKPAPVRPIKYLEAGAKLFNSGDFERAAQYLDAARLYRDQLQADEQTTLDAYLKELSKVQGAGSGTTAIATETEAPQPAAAAPAAVPSGESVRHQTGAPVVTADTKQKAQWLLQECREQMAMGNFEEAEKKLSEAERLDVKWGLFDVTPAKVRAELNKDRPQAAKTVAAAAPSKPGDHRTAKAKLKEARGALANHQYDQAEAIAQEVKGWKLTYSLFEDNPDKVTAASRALRRRDRIRNTSPREQPSQGVYDVLVQESRELMTKGQFDAAEVKARQAQRMNVVPALTADRAESILHDIAMARSRASAGAPAAVASVDSASAKAEREANDLLSRGNQSKASAKFAEAERLRQTEAIAVAKAATVDHAVQRSSGDPGAAPLLDAGPALGADNKPTDKPVLELAPAADAKQNAPALVDHPQAAPAGEPIIEAPKANAPAPSKGEQIIAEAKALYTSGNYPAARQMADEAKSAKLGVDSQADELIAQIGLAEQGGALSLYESALAAMRNGDNARAHALLTEVAAAGAALDENMQAKVQELLTKIPADAPKGKAVLGDKTPQIADSEALAAQKLNAEVGTKIAEARRLQETEPDKAIAIYEQTMKAVKAAGLSPSLMRPMVRRLEVAVELAKKDKVDFDRKMLDKTAKVEIETKRLRILEADKAKKARMKQLMDKAQAAYADGNYVQAETFAKAASEVDPNEVAATLLAFKSRMERRYKTDMETKASKEEGTARAFQEVDMAGIMDPEVQMNGIKMPKNFKDLTRERLRMNEKLAIKKDPKVLAIEAKLRDPISLNLEKQPLSEAITFLQNYTGLNIVLDHRALSDEGITSASPVSLTVNNVQLKSALKLLLRPLGLVYKTEDEVLLITSPQSSGADMYAQPYYVGDLIMPVNRSGQNPVKAATDQMGLASAAPDGANGALGGATPGQSPMGASGPVKVVQEDRPNVDMTPLIQLITTSIAPGTWRVQDNAGQDLSAAYGLGGGFGGGGAGGDAADRPPGAIIPFFLSISLIIRHTAEVHDQVADLLRQLRKLQDLQVSVEVRFITVTDDFFEQIGIDFDFAINSDTVGKHTTFAFPNPAASLTGIGGGNIGGGGAGGGVGGGGAGGGLGGGGAGGGLGGGGGGGGLGGGGGGGGLGGGGGIGGLGGGGGGGGGGLGGGGGGGGLGGGGGTTGGSVPSYLVNPIRNGWSYGSQTPIVVGTQGGGLYNFSNNLNIPFVNTQSSLIAPFNAVPGAGATLGVAFLSDLEVYFFMTAAQGDTRANLLSAPKITTFNGAAAFIMNTELQWYVQSLFPVVGPGSVAFVPSPAPLPNGVLLNVTPVVSSDRRYVRMTLMPTFNTIQGFTTIQVPAAVGGSGLGGGSASINATLQLPQTITTFVSTTVTVPDGGTVLLGGVKRLREERKEYGVPVLSKTPWIDRLFRNVGIGRQSSSLMLMVTPRIIILEEEEERLGIPSTAM